MKKRILALICALATLLPCTAANAAFSDIPVGTEEESMLNILENLGIMHGYEDGSFKPDAPITRAEFVTMVHNSVKIWNSVGGAGGSSEYETFFQNFFLNGGANGMELLIPGQNDVEAEEVRTTYWTDVSEDYWAYQYMKTVATFGIVRGYPDGTFKPTKTVTYNEAITVILNLCGYAEHAKSRGGFPDGYNAIASRYQLAKGLYATGDMELSRMDAARLLYNSFDMEIAPITDNTEKENRTFLSDIVGVYIEEGTLTDTDITSIYHTEVMGENTARLNDIEFTFDKKDVAIRDYIGQEIRVYLKETGDSTYEYTLQSFEVIGKEEKTVIDAELFEDYAGNTFYYKKEKDDRTNKKVEVRNGSVLIYNGKYEPNYSKDLFENINRGTITVIEKKKLDFDIIVVEDFKSGYTDSKNVADMEIYDNIAEGIGNSIIFLGKTESGKPVNYQLMNASGEEIKFEDVATGAINYYQNDDYVKVYFSDKTVKGLLRKEVDESDIYYVVGDEKFRVSDTYLNYVGGDIRANIQGTITVDSFGEVVWMTDDVDMSGYSYIFKTRYNYEDEKALITYYDLGAGEVKEDVPALTDIKFYGVDGLQKDYDSRTLIEELKAYDGISKIDLDDEGNIKRIRLALANAEEASDKLMLVREGNYDYNGARNGSFGGSLYLNSDSKMLNVPIDKTNYDNFKLLAYNSNLWTGSGRQFKLYSFDPESPYARIALAYQKSATSSGIYVDTGTKYYMVTKVAETINADGEFAKEVTLFDGNNYTSVIAKEDENGVTAFDNAFSANAASSQSGFKVERGDFIFYTTDTATGEVEAVRLIFDANGVNPAWCGVDPANKATTCTENHTHITNLGHFPGTTGYYAKNTYSYTNPIGYLNEGASGYSKTPGSANNRQFYVLGYINQLKEGMYEWTTQNIRDTGNSVKDTENYQWAYDKFGTSVPVYIVDEELNVEKGTLQSIKTYKQAGDKCSKVLLRYVGGTINAIWILPN